jgi:hypothetical protein
LAGASGGNSANAVTAADLADADEELTRAAYSASIARDLVVDPIDPPPRRWVMLLLCLFWAVHAAVVIAFSSTVFGEFVFISRKCKAITEDSGHNAQSDCLASIYGCQWVPAGTLDRYGNSHVHSSPASPVTGFRRIS